MEFKVFANVVHSKFDVMARESVLYRVDIAKDELWNLYLKAYPDGTNPVYKERTEHDCNTCKNFIRDVGNVVSIKDGQIETIWDINLSGHYGEVARVMAEFIKTKSVNNLFGHDISKVGAETTRQLLEDKSVTIWHHFHYELPSKFVGITPTALSEVRATVQVFERGLNEISFDAIEIVQELIDQGSLYKGDEFKDVIQQFKLLKKKFNDLESDIDKNRYVWEHHNKIGSRIRNTVIGTLLQDISDGEELDRAVSSFESKVAPTNYKRPTAIVTKGMVEQAMKTIEELGIEPALYRRFATPEDLSVNNVLFANRETASIMQGSLKDELMKSAKGSDKDYSKIEEISITDFVKNVLPNINNMEVLLQNSHVSNLVSIIAPINSDAPNVLKWDNNFTWSYNGNVTDSIVERVKNAGGNVDGFLRFSLSWFNYDDLDLHVYEPQGGQHIFFSQKLSHQTGGRLDVDMNAGSGSTREPVENIVWTNPDRLINGTYKVRVHNFCFREDRDYGFEVQYAYNGEVRNLSYDKKVPHGSLIPVAEFTVKSGKVISFKVGKGIKDSARSREVWGIATEQFHKVNILTLSPNHWDNQNIGNKHYFFILDKCLNDENPRGFYNEFLKGSLDKHRKVFEMISSKTKCELSDRQLSGLGFSSTKRDSLICKVSGNFKRILKIKF